MRKLLGARTAARHGLSALARRYRSGARISAVPEQRKNEAPDNRRVPRSRVALGAATVPPEATRHARQRRRP